MEQWEIDLRNQLEEELPHWEDLKLIKIGDTEIKLWFTRVGYINHMVQMTAWNEHMKKLEADALFRYPFNDSKDVTDKG